MKLAVLASLPPDQATVAGFFDIGLFDDHAFPAARISVMVIRKKFVARIAVLLDRRLIDLQKFERFQIEHPHRIRVAVEQQAVLLFTVAQILLRPPAVGHITTMDHHSLDFRIVKPVLPIGFVMMPGAVLVPVTILKPHRLIGILQQHLE